MCVSVKLPRRLGSKSALAGGSLAVIIVLSLLVATIWAIRTPIFAMPDEDAHSDYVFALYSTGSELIGRKAPPGWDVHPFTRYLEDVSNYRLMHMNPNGRVPYGYGSPPYFRAVDRSAPRAAAEQYGRLTPAIPVVATAYPPLYYALSALVFSFGMIFTGGSLVYAFLLTRFLNVLLLSASLYVAYRIGQERHERPAMALAVVAIIGLLPMTSMVAGYVQPDNLTFAFVSIAIWLSLKARHDASVSCVMTLGAFLALLCATKVHYFLGVALPVLGAEAVRILRRRSPLVEWLVRGAALIGPALVVFSFDTIFQSHGSYARDVPLSYYSEDFRRAAHAGTRQFAEAVAAVASSTYRDEFLGGVTFFTYWEALPGAIVPFMFWPWLSFTITPLIATATVGVQALLVLRFIRIVRRLSRVARRRSALKALDLFFSDTLLNSYVVVGAILIGVSFYTENAVAQQGRYWLPVSVASVYVATRYAPQAFRHFARRRMQVIMTVALAAYSLTACAIGLQMLQVRYYDPLQRPNSFRGRAEFMSIAGQAVHNFVAPEQVRFSSRKPVQVIGWAVDTGRMRPADRVFVRLDHTLSFPTHYGLACPRLIILSHDETLGRSCFEATVDARAVRPGKHLLSTYLISGRQRGYAGGELPVLVSIQ